MSSSAIVDGLDETLFRGQNIDGRRSVDGPCAVPTICNLKFLFTHIASRKKSTISASIIYILSSSHYVEGLSEFKRWPVKEMALQEI